MLVESIIYREVKIKIYKELDGMFYMWFARFDMDQSFEFKRILKKRVIKDAKRLIDLLK